MGEYGLKLLPLCRRVVMPGTDNVGLYANDGGLYTVETMGDPLLSGIEMLQKYLPVVTAQRK